jgi:hypothetical protein
VKGNGVREKEGKNKKILLFGWMEVRRRGRKWKYFISPKSTIPFPSKRE